MDSIIQEKHITNAAKKINITQSALSKSLSRIRNTFNDPILVRVKNGYELTERAMALSAPIKSILQDIDDVIAPMVFEPATTDQMFTIGSLDYGEMVAGSGFMRRIHEKAPHSKIRFIPRTVLSNSHLMDGTADILFCRKPKQSPQNCVVETITRDRYVCLVDKGHPTVGKRFELEDYLKYPHSVLHVGVDELLIDKTLDRIGKKRKTLKQSSNFVALAVSLRETPMILTVPNSALQTLNQFLDLFVHELPFKMPPLELSMIWHKRNQERPDHKWFREEFRQSVLQASGANE